MAMLRSGFQRFGCLRAALKSLAQTDHRSISFCIDRKARLGEGRVGLRWASVPTRVPSRLVALGFV